MDSDKRLQRGPTELYFVHISGLIERTWEILIYPGLVLSRVTIISRIRSLSLRSEGNLLTPKPNLDYCKRMFSYTKVHLFITVYPLILKQLLHWTPLRFKLGGIYNPFKIQMLNRPFKVITCFLKWDSFGKVVFSSWCSVVFC